MSSLPEKPDPREATKTRWKVLEKNVYHLDFRYSISAYDKYFYFGRKPNTKTIKSKQDLIRKNAPRLRESFDNIVRKKYYTREIFQIFEISKEEKKLLKIF